MTKQEHEMMILMFARLNESVGIIVEALRSRDILNADDVKAFSHATHADAKKVLSYVVQARVDYLKAATQSGVTLPNV